MKTMVQVKKRISIKGEVVGEPSLWTANSGTACCKFQVRCQDGIFECIAFHEKASIDGLVAGCIVAVRGSYKDTDAFESKSITVDSAIVEGGKATLKDSIIAEYGSLEAYKAEMIKAQKYKRSIGMIQAKYTVQSKDGSYLVRIGWFHKDRVSKHAQTGENWLAIDLCMNVLGAREVTDRLRAHEVKISPTASNSHRYRDVLDGMLLEVNDILSQEAPF